MTGFFADWLNLLLRWGHMIAGIAWIGTSFYFVALDLSLRKRDGMKDGVLGTAWEVHGGGFYHVEKFTVAPKDLPDDLIWFKWEAYLTWITGFLLLAVQYYWNAGAWLIDPGVMALEPWQAIGISIVSLAAGWIVYDGLCRSPIGRNLPLLAACVFALILIAAYGFTHVFSGRGALIHVGVFIGTLMAFNVFMIIIPNQKKITAALFAGEAPDPVYGVIGKQRSMHNTYLTLPVLVMMVSGHYPMLTNHPHAWLLVGLIVVGGGALRHVLVRHEVGDPLAGYAWTLPVIAVALIAAMWLTAPKARTVTGPAMSDTEVMAISQKHCVNCHAAKPTYEGFEEPPKDVVLETIEDMRRFAPLIDKFAVQSDAMPLGNETGMTDDERDKLGNWIAGL
jgi:uncharacterized membrane protein